MAVEKSQIEIEIDAKIEKYRAEIGKIPGITTKAADKAAEGMRKGLWNVAAKDAAGLGKAAESTAKQMASAFGNLKWAAGATAAVAGIAYGIVELSNRAVEARDRLVEQGLAAQLPEEAVKSIDAYRVATDDLRTAADLATVAVGGGFAGALSDMAYALIGATDATSGLGDAVSATAAFFYKWNPVRATVDLLGIGMHDLADAGKEVAESHRDASKEALDWAAAETDAMVALGLLEEEIPDWKVKKLEKAQKEAAKAAKEEAQATKDATAEQVRYNAAIIDAVATFDRLAIEQNEAQHTQHEIAQAMVESNAQTAAFTIEADKATAALMAYNASGEASKLTLETLALSSAGALASVGQAAGSIADIMGQVNGEQIEQLQDRMAARREEIDQWTATEEERIESMVRSGEISEGEAQTERKRVLQESQSKRRALQQRTREQQEHLLQLFKAQQSAAITSITLDGLAAGIRAVAELGPIAGGIAAGLIAGNVTASILAVKNQDPPEFPTGINPVSQPGRRTPDHTRRVSLRDDEGAFNGRATAALGGLDAVRRLNETGQVGAQTIVVNLDGREIAAGVVDRVGRALLQPTPGSWAAGKRPLYGSR
jgi:hypothetical protein